MTFAMPRPTLLIATLAGFFVGTIAGAAETLPKEARPKRGGDGGRGEARMPTPAFRTEVPAYPWNTILGRPTDRSINVSVLSHETREGWISWGPAGGPAAATPRQTFPAGLPQNVVLAPLQPDTRYTYRFHSRPAGAGDFVAGPEATFTSARSAGATFTFTVQADPHLDFGTDPAVYRKALALAAAARPDFHVDLGDTFMTDKYLDFHDAQAHYLAQRYYFGLIGHGVPLFLVLGNHDGEQPARGGSGPGSMAVWANARRRAYFPNPQPDGFYEGNREVHPVAGPLENYYAWTWGDALFVVLDPYWYSARSRGGDNWDRTLGSAQYEWLRRILAESRARFRFVFLHHLAGGETPEGRGGAEASQFFEWGGRELDGRDTFAARRPGWAAPIHALLARHPGTVVFHGHDHLYAYQQRDGVVYQLVPQPGHSRFDNIRSAAEYGYKSGEIQGASGILRVTVAPAAATVEYVRAYPDAAENASRRTGSVTHRYTVAPFLRP